MGVELIIIQPDICILNKDWTAGGQQIRIKNITLVNVGVNIDKIVCI